MITVRIYGLFREQCEKTVYELEAKTVAELLKKLSEVTGVSEKEWRNGVVFVNRKPLEWLGGFRCRIGDGDEVAVLSPASGG